MIHIADADNQITRQVLKNHKDQDDQKDLSDQLNQESQQDLIVQKDQANHNIRANQLIQDNRANQVSQVGRKVLVNRNNQDNRKDRVSHNIRANRTNQDNLVNHNDRQDVLGGRVILSIQVILVNQAINHLNDLDNQDLAVAYDNMKAVAYDHDVICSNYFIKKSNIKGGLLKNKY